MLRTCVHLCFELFLRQDEVNWNNVGVFKPFYWIALFQYATENVDLGVNWSQDFRLCGWVCIIIPAPLQKALLPARFKELLLVKF